MWHGDKEVASEPRAVPRCFSLHRTGRTVIILYTTPVPHGPRGNSVQVDSIIAACAVAEHMVNNADPASRQVGISLVAIYLQ